MKEIEVLVKVSEDIGSVLARLAGLKSCGVKSILDVYYFDPVRGGLRPGKDFSLKECCRLRDADGSASLAYKVDRFDSKGVWSYSDEHEVEVSDLSATKEILAHLGLEPLVVIDMKKHVFTDKDYEIVVEDVKGLGVFVEVELKDPSPDIDEVQEKQRIRGFISSWGLSCEEMRSGKPELMLKKLGGTSKPGSRA